MEAPEPQEDSPAVASNNRAAVPTIPRSRSPAARLHSLHIELKVAQDMDLALLKKPRRIGITRAKRVKLTIRHSRSDVSLTRKDDRPSRVLTDMSSRVVLSRDQTAGDDRRRRPE